MRRRARAAAGVGNPSALAGLRLLIATASRSDRFGLATSLLLGLLSSVLAAVFPLLFGYLVDASLRGAVVVITAFAVAISLVQAGSVAARSFGSMLSWNLWERMTVAIDEMLVGLTTRLGNIDRVERPAFQERLTLLRTNREHFQESMISLQGAVFLGLQVLVTVVILVTVAPLLLLLPLFSAAPILASRWAERRAQRALRESAADIRSADGFALLAVDATAAGELRVLRLRDLVLRRHRVAWDRAVDRQWRAELVGSVVSTAALLLFTMGFAAAVLYVTTQSLHGHTTLGAVVLVLTAGQQLHNQIGALLSNASALFRVVETMRHLQWLRLYVDEHGQRGSISPPVVLRHGVGLHDVSFRYAGADRDAVSGADLQLPAGAVVAIVGDNGAGKSTLVSLLCALPIARSHASIVWERRSARGCRT
jgi:ATP-binding cassette subfamily B protein